jgi:hypothetical protein
MSVADIVLDEHPATEYLALYATADLAGWQRLRTRWHASNCARCREEIAAFRWAADRLKDEARVAPRAIEDAKDWSRLEREMIGNIAVGLAAARCIDKVGAGRRFAGSAVSAIAALVILFVAGWITHIPRAQTEHLVASLRRALGLTNPKASPTLVETNSLGIGVKTRGEMMLLPTPSSVRVWASGDSQVSATFTDEETGQLLISTVYAQATARPAGSSASSVQVEFGNNSPILMQSLQFEPSGNTPGMSAEMKLRAFLALRNVGPKTIAGLTLRLDIDDLAPAAASIEMPALDARSGDAFRAPVNIDGARSFTRPSNSGLRISLDSVLFEDLSSYGPDTLHSLQALLRYEAENRRERQYLSSLLRAGQLADLREELNFGLPDTPQGLGVAISPAETTSRKIELASLSFPDAPVQVLAAYAELNGSEIAGPQLSIRNASKKAVIGVTVSLLARDEHGSDFVAGTLPERTGMVPGQDGSLYIPATLRLSRPKGTPPIVRSVSPIVTAVEFADGSLWIPQRAEIQRATADPVVRRLLAESPEQQRLASLFRREGVSAVAAELRRLE